MIKKFSITILFATGLVAALASPSFALTSLKQVQVSNGTQIDLLFDGKVSRSQIQTDFFNDIIQLSLSNVSVYPAKIQSVSGGELTKIFAYQYAPKLVRCRLSIKGSADSYKDRIRVSADGKVVTIQLGETGQVARSASPQQDRIATHSAQVSHSPNTPSGSAAGVGVGEEKALLERVMKGTPPSEAKTEKGEKADGPDASLPAARAKGLAGGKAFPSPFSVLWKLTFVVGLFGAIALVVKKMRLSGQNSGLMGAVSTFAKKNLRLPGGNPKMIEVVSTHHLGPKKSIAVVRVAGRLLVLGVSNDAINLITQITSKVGADGSGLAADQVEALGAALGIDADFGLDAAGSGQSAGPSVFSEVLRNEGGKPTLSPPTSNVRSQIRSRLEGLKPL